jgi:exodeoxyribonuclease-5
MSLDNEQAEALGMIKDWIVSKDRQVFRLFGYAGTGKTTLAKDAGNLANGVVLYGAYTGKAAKILTSKGAPADTLHRIIYHPVDRKVYKTDDNGNILHDDKGKPIVDKELSRQPGFRVNAKSGLHSASLLIIDEVSMVGKRMAEDLLAFNKPILVLGDPAQLPPVKGEGYFTNGEPDILLRNVHRHAEQSSVYGMATKIRRGKHPGRMKSTTLADASEYDQIIVGTNKSRWRINRDIRRFLDHKENVPEPGDKVICLANDYKIDVLNGETWRVISYATPRSRKEFNIADIELEDEYGHRRWLKCWHEGFSEKGEANVRDMPYGDRREAAWLTFSWALTCHKSQGSQWGSVLVADEAQVFKSNARQWLYTAVTRAVDSAGIVRPGGIR